MIQVLSAYGADFSLSTTEQENAMFFATRGNHLIVLRLLGQRGRYTNDLYGVVHVTFGTCDYTGCPANEENNEDPPLTPQKVAKGLSLKDAMKELKRLTTFQEKIARGSRPKGAAEPWAVQVTREGGREGGRGRREGERERRDREGGRERGERGREGGRKGGREFEIQLKYHLEWIRPWSPKEGGRE